MNHRPVLLLAIGFFTVTAGVAIWAGPYFTSPDEDINALGASAFREHGTFVLAAALPEDTDAVFRPRNTEIVDGNLVPSSFLSFPFFLALFGAVFTTQAALVFTPLLAALGLFAFSRIVSFFWGERVGLLSAVFLALTPGYLFFTIKGHWHNAAFAALLCIALWLGILWYRRQSRFFLLLSGFVLGIALSFRAVEVLWVGIAALALFWIARHRLNRSALAAFLLCFAIGILPLIALNAQTYGGPFSFGYTAGEDSQVSGGSVTSGFAAKLLRLVQPVDTDVELYGATMDWYGIRFFPFLTFFAALGVIAFLSLRSRTAGQRAWIFWSALIGIWLFWYYGGTPYYGSPVNSMRPILGSSFVRYFLPLTLAAVPLGAFALERIAQRFARRGTLLLVLLFILQAVFTVRLVVFEQENGLQKYFSKDIPQIRNAREQILALTEPGAIIVAGQKDKLFFPERLVMGYNHLSDGQRDLLPRLFGKYTIYYNDIAARDHAVLDGIARKNGYALEAVGMIGQDPLYRFTAVQ